VTQPRRGEGGQRSPGGVRRERCVYDVASHETRGGPVYLLRDVAPVKDETRGSPVL